MLLIYRLSIFFATELLTNELLENKHKLLYFHFDINFNQWLIKAYITDFFIKSSTSVIKMFYIVKTLFADLIKRFTGYYCYILLLWFLYHPNLLYVHFHSSSFQITTYYFFTNKSKIEYIILYNEKFYHSFKTNLSFNEKL